MAQNGPQYFFTVQNIKITLHSSNFYINLIFTVSVAKIIVHTVKCTGTHRNFPSATMNYPSAFSSMYLFNLSNLSDFIICLIDYFGKSPEIIFQELVILPSLSLTFSTHTYTHTQRERERERERRTHCLKLLIYGEKEQSTLLEATRPCSQ